MFPNAESERYEKSQGGRKHPIKYTLRKFIYSLFQPIPGMYATQRYQESLIIIPNFTLTGKQLKSDSAVSAKFVPPYPHPTPRVFTGFLNIANSVIFLCVCFCMTFTLEEEMVYHPGIQCTDTDLHHLVILECISYEITQDK